MSRQFTRDFLLEVAKGNVAGHSLLTKFGYNGDVNSTEEDLWAQGGSLSYLTSAETMNIVSTSTADDGAPAGTGARKVFIEGVDGTYAEVSETVTMDGTTNVLTSNSYLRVHRMYVTEVGSGGENAGIIRATASVAATVQGHIPAGEGQTQQVFATVPTGETWYVVGETFSGVKTGGGGPGSGTAALHFRGWLRLYNAASTNNYESWRQVFDVQMTETGGNPGAIPEMAYAALPEKTDFRVSAQSDTSNMGCNGRLHIIRVTN